MKACLLIFFSAPCIIGQAVSQKCTRSAHCNVLWCTMPSVYTVINNLLMIAYTYVPLYRFDCRYELHHRYRVFIPNT